MSFVMPTLPKNMLEFASVDSAQLGGGTQMALSKLDVAGGLTATESFAQNVGAAGKSTDFGIA